MSEYYDLTGANPDCAVVDREFVVFINNQVLEFKEPVYAASIVVNQLVPSSDPLLLVQNVDWVIRTSDHDTNAISSAKLSQANFDSLLVKSISIKKIVSAQFTVAISFQRFTLPYALNDDPNVPMITPILIKSMIQDINTLLNNQNPVSNLVSDLLTGIEMLGEDTTGLLVDNLVEEELHTINVPANKQIIRPGCGSFYSHDLVVTRVSGNTVLVKNVDYRIIGPNLAKQKVSQNTNGIYDYILILSPIVGEIKITYHAFGGMVMPTDVENIRGALVNVMSFLNSSDLLTNQSLGTNAVITSIINRITVLEELERHYLTSTFTVNSTAFHWYNIAYLYDTDWNDGNVAVNEVGQFRIQSKKMGWVYDLMVAANVNRTSSPLTVNVLSGQDRNSQVDYLDYSRLADRIVPKLRLIWKTDGSTTGAVLQLGIRLTGTYASQAITNDIIQITNKSSSASRWKLYKYMYETLAAQDSATTLPSGAAWALATDSYDYKLISPPEGYLTWAGNMPMHLLVNSASYNHFGHNDMAIADIPKIGKIKFNIFDRITGQFITCEDKCRTNGIVETAISGTVMFFIEDLCCLTYTVSILGIYINITLNAVLGTHSTINERFDLRQVSVLFE